MDICRNISYDMINNLERILASFMTWNISFSLVTGIMLCIILGYYVAYPRLPIVLNRFFVALSVAEMVTLALDIASSVMDMNHENYSTVMLMAVNMLYFLFFTIRDYGMFSYTVALVSGRKRIPRMYILFSRVLFVVFELINLSSLFAGTIFSVDADGFRFGPAYMVTHIQVFVYLIMGIFILIRCRSEVNNTAFYGMELVYSLLIIGGILRFFFPEYLLLDSFYMMAVMILYIAIHNSDLYRESRTVSFDFQAMEMVVREHHSYGQWYQLIGIMPYNYEESRQIYGGVQMDRVLTLIGKYLQDIFTVGTVFYERSGCFLILIDGKESANRAISDILPAVVQRFHEPWDGGGDAKVYMSVIFGQMNSDLNMSSVDLEMEVIRRLLNKGGSGELDHDFIVDKRMIDEVTREFAVKKALSDALIKNGIQVYMQPIIEASSGKVAGAEALSRLSDPQLGLIPPSEFIPLAERSGSIIQLGEQVLSKTCAFLADNADRLHDLSFVNINLSPIQCMDHDLEDTFDLVPKTYGIDPERLHLEITEESMVDPDVLKSQMESLGLLGYVFALDDYGSGYANQFRIKTFPFSGIKLDMSIVWAHFRDPDAILPNAVLSFLDRGLTVTAEGVETAQMAEQLTKMGCTYLQGYYYSKPLPMDEFLEYIQQHSATV